MFVPPLVIRTVTVAATCGLVVVSPQFLDEQRGPQASCLSWMAVCVVEHTSGTDLCAVQAWSGHEEGAEGLA